MGNKKRKHVGLFTSFKKEKPPYYKHVVVMNDWGGMLVSVVEFYMKKSEKGESK